MGISPPAGACSGQRFPPGHGGSSGSYSTLGSQNAAPARLGAAAKRGAASEGGGGDARVDRDPREGRGQALEGERERCEAAGMDDFVPKPITPSDLGSALERWTGTRA